MATGTAGANAATLQTIKNDQKATAAVQATIPKDTPEGKVIAVTKTGDASWTTIVQAHGLTVNGAGVIPTHVILSPTSAAGAAAAWVSAKDATNFTITFGAAPANAAVASFSAFVVV